MSDQNYVPYLLYGLRYVMFSVFYGFEMFNKDDPLLYYGDNF